MVKEEWLKARDLVNIPMKVWYEYYRENGGKLTNIDEFSQVFSEILHTMPVIPSFSGVKRVTFASAVRRFNDYYNQKFQV